jgi:tetratricopeptide (TPR) repeat protein
MKLRIENLTLILNMNLNALFMKRIILFVLLIPVITLAQKEIKPSVAKAETALQKGIFDEAKSIIDATVANQEYMVDKKGQPSKNAAKAWYLKGVIYTAIDTTKSEKFKSLVADPFPVAQEAFAKAEEIDKGKNESLVNGLTLGFPTPISKDIVSKSFAQAFLERGYKIYQAKDFKKAFVDIEKVVFFVPKDTTQLMNAGVYFAPAAGEDDKSIGYIRRYQVAGGKNPDAFVQLYSIYTKRADASKKAGKEKDKKYDALLDSVYMNNTNKALGVAKELTAKYPSNMDFLNLEYNIYTSTNRLPEAKALMEKRATADPNDKESRYFLGLICNELKDIDCAKHWMIEAVKVDPDYFDANLVLAKLTYADAQKLRNDRNAITGSKDADLKKRQELFKQIPIKLKESIVYWEKCAVINSSDADGLYGLLSIYSDISLYDETYEPKIVELKKKMKALGLEVD